jgi:hypothetical protein
VQGSTSLITSSGYTSSAPERPRIVRSSAGDLLVLARGDYWSPASTDWEAADGLHHRPAAGGAWRRSFADPSLQSFALAWTTGKPWFMTLHNGALELATPDPHDRWSYDAQTLGPGQSGEFDLKVDSRGRPRACFVRSGNLVVY